MLRPAPRARALAARWAALLLAGLALQGCAPSLTGNAIGPPTPDEADRQRYARHQIQFALSFRSQGRLESAEHALDAALAAVPDHPRALRLKAVVLEDLGQLAEAERARARADAVDPPPPLPPDAPVGLPSEGVLVVIPPPEVVRGRDEVRVAGGWPGGEAVAALLRRIRTRLPEAQVLTADPETVADVRGLLSRLAPRAVLSLRMDRAYCSDTEKDGPFSVAWLRVAAARPGERPAPETVRHVEWIPPQRHCVRIAVARAFEAALARGDVRAALSARARPAGAEGPAWSGAAVRTLFPGLSVRIAEELERGRARLATGRLGEALEAFRRAARIDPDDPNVQAYLQEAELTLAMARELGGEDPGSLEDELEPQLTAAQRQAAQQLLDEERRRRDALLAALLVRDASERVPPPEALAHLRSVVEEEPGGPGERLAATLAEGPLEARTYLGPDGTVLARYWFAEGQATPVLRESDSDDDGAVDRWEGYVGETRRHLWEDRQGLGRPDLHMEFAEAGGVERIEVDGDGDGRPERIFRYDAGRLVSESRDTDADGRLDRVETFDTDGFVALREDDLDGDGEADVKSFYDRGSLVRREILDPELVDELVQ